MKRFTNPMKLVAGSLLLAGVLTVSGCSLIDGAFGIHETQATSEDGDPLFRDANGMQTEEAIGANGLPNEPWMVRKQTSEGIVGAAPGLLSLLGPWGALAGTIFAGAAGVYVRVRTGRSDAKTEAAEAAGRFLIVLIEKIKTGVADVFIDGKLDNEKLRAWLKEQGQQFSDPKYLDEMVQKVTKGL